MIEPLSHTDLSSRKIVLDCENYFKEQNHFLKWPTLSYLNVNLENDLLPNLNSGNYSMFLNHMKHGQVVQKEVETVSKIIANDMRTSLDSYNTLKDDLKIFEEYANFNIGDIHLFKQRN